MADKQTFRTTLFLAGKTAMGIVVPDAVVEALSAGKRPAVTVTINDRHTYRSTVAPMGGQFLIPVAAEQRNAAGVTAGEEIDVTLELDTAPRMVDVPDDLQAALNADEPARVFFESLAYSHKLRHVLSINDAKTPETRARRIDKALEMLRSGKK
jgi:hypothetical protein